ncbi:hypothetical protein [Winogradskya humida]|uniref:Excreted virulence factor EspC (Type VII ESX diderm) n=1 Tax=Winogradskya humida TaxID=113566 RepID=A0ABQ3ZLA9_9ACTN|nr:hypothetical protein [Actinoplanes humidus]GIE19381.1 hypothetical protein Ahu01nite_024830 [Actinoplanes humidus]
MSEGMAFPAETVLRHAGSVGEASDGMAQARDAAATVAMGSEAYGQLCQFLPALLNPLFSGATDVLSDAVDALGETELNLRATASAMTGADSGSAQRFRSAVVPGLELPL